MHPKLDFQNNKNEVVAELILISAVGPKKQVSSWAVGCLLSCTGDNDYNSMKSPVKPPRAGTWQSAQQKSSGGNSLLMGDIAVNKL